MAAEDRDPDETPGSPNPRRDDPRPSPIIEGTAQEIPETREEPPSTAHADEPRFESAPPEAPRSSSAGILPIAAIALAIVALVAAGALWLRILEAPRGSNEAARDQALSARVDALQSGVAAAQGLEQRVAALESTLKSDEAASAAARDQAAKALAAADAARTAAARTVAPAAPSNAAGLAAFGQQVSSLGQRVSALERRPDPTAKVDQLSAKLSDLDQKLAGLQGSLDSVTKIEAGLQAQLGAEAARLTPLEGLLKAPKVDVGAIDARTSQALGLAQASALLVTARSLQQAVDSGEPFASELAVAAKLGADPALLKPLQASAGQGVATLSQLSRSFDRLVGPVLAGLGQKSSEGVLGRLASEAGSLVQIRTVGPVTGDSPSAVVGRIESALDRGDLATALKQRDLLPSAAKETTADWAARAQERLAAQQAARALSEDAMKQMGKART